MGAQLQTRGPDSPNSELPESWGTGGALEFLVISGGTGSLVRLKTDVLPPAAASPGPAWAAAMPVAGLSLRA